MNGDKELFDMLEGRGKAVPRAMPKCSVRKKRSVGRMVGSAATTALFVAATVLGYMDIYLGILVVSVCYFRLACRIWRWRHG